MGQKKAHDGKRLQHGRHPSAQGVVRGGVGKPQKKNPARFKQKNFWRILKLTVVKIRLHCDEFVKVKFKS